MSVAAANEYVAHASLAGKLAVVIGGTMGVGAACARLLAKTGCSRVIIVGRNAERAEAVLGDMRAVAPDAGAKFEFIQGDLMELKGMRDTASAIAKAVGPGGIDYLFQTQNGMVTGTLKMTSDGLERGFAVQAASRCIIAYLLADGGFLAKGARVVAVANPGNTLDIDPDDMSLTDPKWSGYMAIKLCFNQSMRDSTVLDSFWTELQERFPQYEFYHLGPGLVHTENFDVSTVPFPLNVAFWIGLKTVASTPDGYAPIPVYVAIHPEGDSVVGSNTAFNYNIAPLPIGAWASVKENRDKVWDRMVKMARGE